MFDRIVGTVRVSLLLLCAVALAGCTATPASPPANAPVAVTATVPQGGEPNIADVARLLAALPVRDRDPVGYQREAFGEAWKDVDRNGCDQRNDVLRRDLTDVGVRPGTHGCLVDAGILRDPYTGETVVFQRGPRSSAVQIDHRVSLADAYRSGANTWTAEQREQFANDLDNLVATAGEVNQAKGDRTADEWTPTAPGARCRYATAVITVKARYVLSVSAPEQQALAGMLATCRGAA